MKYGPLHTITNGITVASPTDLHLRATQRGVPYPGALATAGYALLTLLSQQVESPGHEESTLLVALKDGSAQRLPVNHSDGGYWKPAVVNAEALLHQMIKHPERRGLLAHPEHIIRRYANATRWRRRTLPRQ